MDAIVYTLYECEDESVIIRTLSMKFIVINVKKKNIISLRCILVCQSTFSTKAFSFSHKTQYIFFPIYFLLGAHDPPWPTSCLSWEYHWTRHLIFNCFDSCSIDVLMFSYIVLTCCGTVGVLLRPLWKSEIKKKLYMLLLMQPLSSFYLQKRSTRPEISNFVERFCE